MLRSGAFTQAMRKDCNGRLPKTTNVRFAALIYPQVNERNVNQPIDVPWFTARWNKNKKRVFKANKFVKRLKKIYEPDNDAGQRMLHKN
ncbi:hypothetical protein MBANPS3_012420 [Mucor bainieri]